MIDILNYDWNKLSVLSKNREAPRTHFYPYANAEAAFSFNRSNSKRVQSLNGSWNFNWFSSPLEVPDALLVQKFNKQEALIDVPMNWQYAGYGKFCYTDLLYPFPVNPPHVPAQNETGVYRKSFKVCTQGGFNTFLRFEGVESAFHVYVNGRQVGYSQGSRTPSEFDVTDLVQDGENQLCVVVYQYSDGSYLEDQDMWWLGGITREVIVLQRPLNYAENFVIDADYKHLTRQGILKVNVQLAQQNGGASLELFDAKGISHGSASCKKGLAEIKLANAAPWTAETPNLYTVVLSVFDEDGNVTEAIPQKIGFRRIEIIEGVLLLNGMPIFMRGVNRHEYNPKTGRAVSEEYTRKELCLIRDAGLNAIRCSHYPNNPFVYDICNEIGLYVMDECDLETHGFEPLGIDTYLCTNIDWQEAYLDRVQRMVERDRNNPCIIMWSLGNESAYGGNFKAMYQWIKNNEPTRPVHYEGDFKNQSVDVSSTMYSTVGKLKEIDSQLEPKHPHIHCEFAHAMGNGPGGLREYFEVCENSARIQGVFVWEFKDHGVYEKADDGKEYYRFGGEFGEAFHNENFCMDGLVRSDGVPSPGFWEYSRVAQPIHVQSFNKTKLSFCVKNRFDFLDLELFRCEGTLLQDGRPIKKFKLEMPKIAPHTLGVINLPENLQDNCENKALITLELRFYPNSPVCASENTNWVLGFASTVLRGEEALPVQSPPAPNCVQEGCLLKVNAGEVSFEIEPAFGRIKNYCASGVLLLENGPLLNYNRPYTDNDMLNRKMWEDAHLNALQMSVHGIKHYIKDKLLYIIVNGHFGPGGKNWGAEITITYTVSGTGAVKMNIIQEFYGKAPEELPKIGSISHLPASLEQVTWRGFGPDECYRDSRDAASDGIWCARANGMGFEYTCPQENANRTGVHWAVFANTDGAGLAIAAQRPVDMAVRPYSDEHIQNTKHSQQLEKDDKRLYLHLDYINSGLGSGSCGPSALAQYKAYPISCGWSMVFSPALQGQTAEDAGRTALGFLLG